MPKKTPQFFNEPVSSRPRRVGSNLAVYTIPPATEKDTPTLVLVECSEGTGNVPRNATSFMDLKLNLQTEMDKVRRIAQTVVEALKQLSPGEVEVEFGIELGGSAGIPLITKHEAKANFKVTLKWKEHGGTPRESET